LGARRLARALQPWRQPARTAVYHTPHSPSDAGTVVEHRVKVAPWISRMRPAWEALRHDDSKELSKEDFLGLCPRVQPAIVDQLFAIFDRRPRNNMLSYEEMCAYILLASDAGTPEEKLESLFPLCDTDGDGRISCSELAGALRTLYYARFRDLEVVDLKAEKLLEEVTAAMEGDDVSLREFTEWARSDQERVTELRELLQAPLVAAPEEGAPEIWAVEAQMGFEKIKVENPIVELDGDEMTRIIWQMIKEKLVFPFLDMDIDYYDLSITYRDETDDQVTRDAAKAIRKCNVGIKCSTITPDAARMLEFNLQQMWKRPSGTIRHILDCTGFYVPIVVKNIPRYVRSWTKPVVLARHAHADQYDATELVADGPGAFRLAFVPEDGGEPHEVTAHTFKSAAGGVMMGMYNTRESIENFARSCFEFALSEGLPLYLSTKSTVMKAYDGLFIEVFHHMFQSSFKKAFEERGLWYQHHPINDMVARALKSQGGFVWATKNYDGDVLSSLVANGSGSPGLVTSVLLSADGGTMVTEAAHGTVTRHYRAHQRGEKTSTNPMALIFAWTRGLAHRAKLDGNERLAHYSRALEQACITCVENGQMSRDLAVCVHGEGVNPDQWLLTEDLLDAIANELRVALSKPLRPSDSAQISPFPER